MKKYCVMIVLVLLSLLIHSASGDNLFQSLREQYTRQLDGQSVSESNDEQLNGETVKKSVRENEVIEELSRRNTVILTANYENRSLSLIGPDSDGIWKEILWSGVEPQKLTDIMVDACTDYGQYESSLTDCNDLYLVVLQFNSMESITANDPASADNMAVILTGAVR